MACMREESPTRLTLYLEGALLVCYLVSSQATFCITLHLHFCQYCPAHYILSLGCHQKQTSPRNFSAYIYQHLVELRVNVLASLLDKQILLNSLFLPWAVKHLSTSTCTHLRLSYEATLKLMQSPVTSVTTDLFTLKP